jgi:hypothetical protein
MSSSPLLETIELVTDDLERAAEIADKLGVAWLSDAGRRLSYCLPSIDSLVQAAPRASIDDEDSLERLDDRADAIQTRTWQWTPTEFPDTPGVYRMVGSGFATFWLRRQTDTRRVGERSVAIYGHLRSLMHYDPSTQVVSFHREARPPSLHLRTLVLCSGRLPVPADRQRLALSNVPLDIAHRVADSLRQQGVA